MKVLITTNKDPVSSEHVDRVKDLCEAQKVSGEPISNYIYMIGCIIAYHSKCTESVLQMWINDYSKHRQKKFKVINI